MSLNQLQDYDALQHVMEDDEYMTTSSTSYFWCALDDKSPASYQALLQMALKHTGRRQTNNTSKLAASPQLLMGCYLKLLGHAPMNHQTWPKCEFTIAQAPKC